MTLVHEPTTSPAPTAEPGTGSGPGLAITGTAGVGVLLGAAALLLVGGLWLVRRKHARS